MSMKIPWEYRNTPKKKIKLKCLLCKHMKWGNTNTPKYKCNINSWKTRYDKEKHECKDFKRNTERIDEIRACTHEDCNTIFRILDGEDNYCIKHRKGNKQEKKR